MKNHFSNYLLVAILILLSCSGKNDREQLQREVQTLDINRGEITLCGSEEGAFGKVNFSLSCVEKVRADFNLATALLHSFEYAEAEKVFAKVIDEDPECLMAYWGVAMSNFHPLWTPPTKEELVKGFKTIKLARTLKGNSTRETDYLEAVASFYDGWDTLDHKSRVLKFETASERIYQKYPEDIDAGIFYALALRAASDPTDKSFAKQRKAGEILNAIFPNQPDHPGIAHYLIHTYDYPELAELALPAARKYAVLAATSAHALHMPSHIFTRLGLWDESIQSNINSMSAATCYAENSGIKGHWDEELHGLDYLVYAYLQQGNDELAEKQFDYLRTFDVVFPLTNKNAYTFAAVPTRLALERKDWKAASALKLYPLNFPWTNFPWERSIVSFGKILGAVHLNKIDSAKSELKKLNSNFDQLVKKSNTYEAKQVQVQIKASEAWIHFAEGDKAQAIVSMTEAADMEDATEKHPVTPGEVVPARELLGDLFMEMKNYPKALEAYEADLQRHAGRFNALYGAGLAAQKSGDTEKATRYFQQLLEITKSSEKKRQSLILVESFIKKHT